MVVYKLRDTFRRARVARDNRASRVTLFVHFRQNVKPSGFRRASLYQMAFSFFVNNSVTVHAFGVFKYAFLDVSSYVVV